MITVIRTRRRSLALYVRDNGAVEVRAPLRLSTHRIERFLAAKQAWLKAKQQELATRPQAYSYSLTAGEQLMFKGDYYRLVFSPDTPIRLCGQHLETPALSASSLYPRLLHWYRQQALATFKERCWHYQTTLGVMPVTIRLSRAQTKWGHCDNKGNLAFNWALILAPPTIINYVVIHELAHLIHFNHSPAFWQTVSQIYPDYKTARAWLKQNKALLSFKLKETGLFNASPTCLST